MADPDRPPEYLRRGPLAMSDPTERRLAPSRFNWNWRRGLPAVIALVTLSAFAGAVWLAYEQGVRQGLELSPPLIRAEPGPVKIQPENVGGLEVPNQDKEVFEILVPDGARVAEERVEQLLPPPEEPLPAPVAAPPPAAQAPVAPELPPEGPELAALGPGAEAVAAPAPPEEPLPAAQPPFLAAAQNPAPAPAPPPEPEPAPAVEAVPPAQVVEAAPPLDERPDLLASVRIQLGSFRENQQALGAWDGILEANPDLLEGLEPLVRTADLGDRGVFYRLQAGPLETYVLAIALCDVLRARGTDCLAISPSQ